MVANMKLPKERIKISYHLQDKQGLKKKKSFWLTFFYIMYIIATGVTPSNNTPSNNNTCSSFRWLGRGDSKKHTERSRERKSIKVFPRIHHGPILIWFIGSDFTTDD